ncbi:hypothetical protein B6U93_03040 [Candidatus Woesearchaeota archaeon ex4484_78]|nr:MAG: hypothetical protein B6U93_03040 [Candidatus Woesearchaeota archaeon ex4484_78]
MKHTPKVTAILVTFFILAQLIGLSIISSYIDKTKTTETGKLTWKELPSIAGMKMERPEIEPKTTIIYVTIALIIGTTFLLLIIKHKKMLLWKVWFLIAVTMCMQIAFKAKLPNTPALIIALILGIWKTFKPNILIHNFTELFIYGGLAAIFVPILNIFYAYMLLIIISAYDMYAVWKSKHMIKMAKFQTKTGIFAGLLIPYTLTKSIKKQKTKKTKTIKTAVLGGGDIGFPLLFSGTILVLKGWAPALITTGSATIALLILLSLSKKGKFYPAMPFLTIGCATGHLISLLI